MSDLPLFLGNSPFACLKQSDREKLIDQLEIQKFSKGQTVHDAGDIAQGIYCVTSGVVRISSCDEEGRYILVKDLIPGEWFRFMGFFGNGKRPQDASATRTSSLVYLPGPNLEKILEHHPQIYRAILNQLAEYSVDFFAQYASAVNLSLYSRILAMLSKLKRWQNTSELTITQADLAFFLGVTREAVNIQLNELQKQGFIHLNYKKIHILKELPLSNTEPEDQTPNV